MSMSDDELDIIANNCNRVHFNTADRIIKQNDPGDSLFVIADGVVSVQVEKTSGDLYTVSKLGVGDFFGEMSLMTGEPRTANVIAESPTVTLSVERDVIKRVFEKNPRVSDMISDVLAKRKVDLENAKISSEEEVKKARNIAADLKKAIINFLS